MSSTLLQLQDVNKRYGDTLAINDLTLDIEEYATTVLIGPSGCGKSTLLRMIAGLVRPDQGVIRFAGRTLAFDGAALRSYRHQLGYVIQEGGLFPHLTAFANITLLAQHLRWTAVRINHRVEQLCALAHLPDELLHRFPRELSGGQRQRVALMRALMLDPPLLLLDEPLGALDPMIRYQLQKELRQTFASLDKTVIMVTHDLAEASWFGQQIVLMRDGRIEQQGASADLFERPASDFVSQFIRAQRGHQPAQGSSA